jgi:hypothetical protein
MNGEVLVMNAAILNQETVESFGVRAPAQACSRRDIAPNISPDVFEILKLKIEDYQVAELAQIKLAELTPLICHRGNSSKCQFSNPSSSKI